MSIKSVRQQLVDDSIRFKPPGLVPDTWLPFSYHRKVVLAASKNKRQPRGEKARPRGEPTVIAVAKLTLRDPVRQPVLRYTSAPCRQTSWDGRGAGVASKHTGDCIHGLPGVVPNERYVMLNAVRDY